MSLYLLQTHFLVVEENQLGPLTETLKWGEPSYLTPKGSTLRMDWKAKSPHTVSLFFNCHTTIVETVKEIFGGRFSYEGTRELIIPITDDLPTEELVICITLTLNYQKIKHLPLLGF